MRGAKVERDIVSYTLFVSFFPHLIAGPLVHHAEMIPQFKRGRTGRSAVLAARGLAIFAAGLFKKVVIADNLAQFVTPVFAHLDAGGGVTTQWAWLSTLAYTLQIYFDFSGYSDMAVGLALLFGIRLPVNFRSPYKATSIIEFWRRWHITLSRFLRDYLYIPLGGNRLGEQRRYQNLLVTMLLGGLWHGAAWNFVIWGGLHGIYLCINHLWRAWRGDAATHSPCDETCLLGRHVFRRRHRLGILPRQDRRGRVADARQPVRLRGRQLRLCLAGNPARDGSADPGRRAVAVVDRRLRRRAGAGHSTRPAQRAATVSLSRIPPRA